MIRGQIEQVKDYVEEALELYRQSPLVKACVQAAGTLAFLFILDAIARYPSGLRMAYVAPIWLAARTGGKRAGWIIVAVTTLGLAVIDANNQPGGVGVWANLLIQAAVLSTLMHLFYSVERNLRDATNRATKDPLTGLYNRFALDQRAKRMIDRALLKDQPLVLAMIDCDRFKELNDTFGHAYGDQVLRVLGRTLKRSLPQDALAARNGGDEFVILFPDRSDVEAAELLESALDRFMSLAEIIGRCSGFSYGIAVLKEDGIDYDRLHVAADQDMYRRKSLRSAAVAC